MYNSWYDKGPFSRRFCLTVVLISFYNCDADIRIGDTLYNDMAYADDITLFSTNVQDLKNLIDICVAYNTMWKFKFGVDNSKRMIVGKCSLYQAPKWRLEDKCRCNEESLIILGNVFNRDGNNGTNRLTKCRQLFYVLGSASMLYPGVIPDVQAHFINAYVNPR